MYIKYKNKEFVGFDDIRHKDLYNRYNNLKKVKDDLVKNGFSIKDVSVYKDLFRKYDLYDKLNKRISNLISLYKKENLNEQIDRLNLSYKKKIDNIVESGQNKNQVYIFVRLFWTLSFFKEYFIYNFVIIKKNFLNDIRNRKKTH